VPNIDLLILGILQGVTEFLPLGSSGHLLVAPQYYCWAAPGLALQLAALAGAVAAAMLYFVGDLAGMVRGFLKVLQGKRDGGVRLIGLLLVTAIPYLALALALQIYAPDALQTPLAVGVALVGFGVLLYGADKLGLTVRRVEHITFGQALMIGTFQCLAVIPGAGGTCLTIISARVLGFERPDAVRLAALLTIPILLATLGYKAWLFYAGGFPAVDWAQAALVFGAAFVAGFLAIAFLMYWVRRGGFLPFVLYRVAIGLAILAAFVLSTGPSC
jgi:undecaprenyl-diphosphatase